MERESLADAPSGGVVPPYYAAKESLVKPRTTLSEPLYRVSFDEAWEVVDGVRCVVCPACAFTFDAFHTDADGSYSCPACAEIALIPLLGEMVRTGEQYLDTGRGDLDGAIAAARGFLGREKAL